MKLIKKLLSLLCMVLLFSSCAVPDGIGENDHQNIEKEQRNQTLLLDALQSEKMIFSIDDKGNRYLFHFTDESTATFTKMYTPLLEIENEADVAKIKVGNNGNWTLDGRDTGMKAKVAAELQIQLVATDGRYVHFFKSDDSILKTKLANPYQGSTVYIMGDSYSTFKDWIPKENATWYPDPNPKNPNVTNVKSVDKTWWYMLIDELGMKLMKNNSWSGTTICNTGYNGKDVSHNSYIGRMQKDLGKNATERPDVLIVYGGTNDSWSKAPIGELKYENWTGDDLKKVVPAACYMFDFMTKNNPDALIINITNKFLEPGIVKGLEEASKHYGVHNVTIDIQLDNKGDFSGWTNGSHPTILGMERIKNAVKELMLSL